RCGPLVLCQELLDRFGQQRLFLSQFEVHVYSWGRRRSRSATMLRWICCVPPSTVAVREKKYVSYHWALSASASGASRLSPSTSSAVAAAVCSASDITSLTLELAGPTASPFRNLPTVRLAW